MDILINKLQASESGTALVTTDYGQDSVIKGRAFAFEKNFAISSGATLYILIDYTTYLKTENDQGVIIVMPPFFQTSTGPVTVNIYRDTKYSGGTPFDCINLNTLVTKKKSDTTFTSGATGTDKGSVVLQYLVGGASQGNQSASGAAGGIGFFVRPNTSKSLIEIINGAGSDITFHFAQVIHET